MTTIRANLLSFTRALLTFGFHVGLLAWIGALVATAMGYPLNARVGVSAALAIEPPVLEGRVLAALLLVSGAVVLPALWLLRAIVESARSGDPFVPENGARLRRIGWLVLVGNVITTQSDHIASHHVITFPPIGFSGLVTVLLVFVLARIFDTGTRMRTEIRETI
jgi:Protein of unknown function (DUF2975)